MMICPETFYEMRLKGKTKEEIMTVIRGLKREIGHLKNIVENPEYDSRELVIHPTEKVQISMSREYLERANQALIEVGGTYTPSKAEQRAAAFEDNIPYIKKVVFRIGGYFTGYTTKTYTIEDDKVHVDVEHSLIYDGPDSDNDKNCEWEKEEFLDQLDALCIGEWRRKYDTKRFGWVVMDGTQWGLEIYYSNGHRAVKINGNNAYPYNFDRVLELFEMED